jgi:hypothetical protein
MQFEIEQWLKRLTEQLENTFGRRLLYVGLGGSFARGEATEESDIDVNIVLDRLNAEDLIVYRKLIGRMPEHERSCGFICGKKEMEAWPRHELFQFMQGSVVIHGTLKGIVAPPTREEIRENILNTSSLIYHEACHRYIFSEDPSGEAQMLKPAYKLAFFILQEYIFLMEDAYFPTKRELQARLEGEDKTMIETLMNWESYEGARKAAPDKCFFELAGWAGNMMTRAMRIEGL